MDEGMLAPVTREQIARYAAAVNDFNRIHVDAGFAQAMGLPDVVAHGPLTVSLVLDGVLATGRHDRLTGLRARLRAPVLPGDVLAWRVTDHDVEVRNGSDAVVASIALEDEETPE